VPQGPIRKGAGQLRHQVEIQYAVVVTDDMGGRSQTWETLATVAGSVEPQVGIVGSMKAEVITLITIRYIAGVEAEQRAIANGVTYSILAVINPEQRNRELILHCMEPTV
jgi:SPP1 family predicted phage head-tail adaptor